MTKWLIHVVLVSDSNGDFVVLHTTYMCAPFFLFGFD